ncbi:hypothetical protein G6M89_08330 [Natronolimnobius sp. AArcel1]|uniref:hypothetical protein n=1 Tax=Natronolimnobius sp. AArcel1 TaxID=1679093 RepID=UPI0013EAC537|nr:hypothetical protein [Natronolimnobius sp. AArcel1]NGM69018.1 hypothetical protein [Natronolimnobius sp. AArcel1]
MSDLEIDDVDALLEDGEEALTSLETALGDVDSLDELEDSALEDVIGDVETLATVASSMETVLETIDLTELPDAIDGDEVLEALEVGEIPDALTEEETGASDVVNFTHLFRAIDLLNAWDATDLGDLWEEKRELEDAVGDLGDGEDDGLVGEAVSSLTDDDGDGDLLDDVGDGDLLDDADMTETLGDIDVMDDPEAYQVAIQQGAMEGIDAFRTALLETHAKFERLYEFNREKMRRQNTGTNSRNPTAASTLPTERAAVGSGVKHSTVPREVRYSTAPSRKRIYGQRFEQERKKRRDDND